ncbi:MAG: putative toxin-antitoxin system toxin component, PIN family [Planctomycetaceae bacterium]|nr:putative toxin-antitoxin system toxin component, PIN family [Planctomycetaceae bacterium]
MLKSKNEKTRLIVDANAWISSLLSPGFRARLEVVFDSKYRLMVSGQLFRELGRTIHKPYLARHINQADYETLVSRLRFYAELVDVRSTVGICRDTKEAFSPRPGKRR